jgi:hypothetical protein
MRMYWRRELWTRERQCLYASVEASSAATRHRSVWREQSSVASSCIHTRSSKKNLDRQGCNRFRFNIHGHVIFRGLIQVYHIRERAVMRFVIDINSPNNPIRSNPILSESLSSLTITSPGIACHIPYSTTPPITTLILTLYRTLV